MRHGRHSTYIRHRCRCPDCREAHRIAQAATRHRRAYKSAVVPDNPNGSCLCIGCFQKFSPQGHPAHERACLTSC